MIPGEYVLSKDPITCNAGKATRIINVVNRGDRPIQVGSHYHFSEANPQLQFDRLAARGMRLDSPAGTAVRFEPGDARSVHLVELGGAREVYGLRDEVNGPVGSTVSMFSTEAIGGSAGYDIARDPDLAVRHEEYRKVSAPEQELHGEQAETVSPVKNSTATDDQFAADPDEQTNSMRSVSRSSGDVASQSPSRAARTSDESDQSDQLDESVQSDEQRPASEEERP